MLAKEIVFAAWTALWHRKGRSILTLTSLVIGIAAIIIMMAVGNGAKQKIAQKIMAMGNNFLYIYRGNLKAGRKVSRAKNERSKPLTTRDFQAIKQQVFDIAAISPMTISRQTISAGDRHMQIDVKSGNEHLFKILNRQLALGAAFCQHHLETKAKVIVLGMNTAQELFGNQTPLLKTVKLEGQPFIVIGVLEKIANYFGLSDPNNDGFVPFSTAKQKLLKESNNQLSGIAISLECPEKVFTVTRQIKRVLRNCHKLPPNSDDDFSFIDQQNVGAAASASVKILSILLLLVACICLLVGGIGVMNIMLVCVSERTREIGIRMALGAQKQHILLQFLYEAMLLSGCGGVLGIFFGVGFSWLMNGWFELSFILTPTPIIISFGLTVAVGIFFGLYPAYQAASLNPCQALFDN